MKAFLYNMSEIFSRTRLWLADTVIGWAEFKLQQRSSYDLSALLFPNFKKLCSRKAFFWTSLNGMGPVISEIYSGSIVDSNIAE